MSVPDPDNETLDEPQFMRLFVQHEPLLRYVARSMLSDWTAVDDVLQEAGITMWEKIDKLENADGFLPWARVIVRLKCHSVINASKRRRSVNSEEAIKLLAVEVDNLDREQYEVRLRSLRGCLAKLSPEHRDLVLAPYREDKLVSEIAVDMGKSVNALYKKLGRLRAKLSSCVRISLASASTHKGLSQ